MRPPDGLPADGEILDLFFARDPRALELTGQKYGRLCRAAALRLLGGSDTDAEEVVNDAYLALWNAVPPHRPEDLRSYLCRIVRNCALARLRSDRALCRDSSADLPLDEVVGTLAEPAAEDTEERLGPLLNGFLAGLEKDDRLLFVRRYWFGESVAALAAERGRTAHYVSVRLHRMREKLRKILEKKGIRL